MKKYKTIRIEYDRVPVQDVADPNIVVGYTFSLNENESADWQENSTGVIVLIDSGLLDIRSAEETLICSSGMLVYIPAGFPFRYRVITDRTVGWFISLPRSKVKFLASDYIQILGPSKLLLGISEEIVSWGLLKKDEKTFTQKRLVRAFLDELGRAKVMHHLTVPIPPHPGLCIVACEILRHPENKDGLNHWAKVAGMSRRSFTNQFSKSTGLTFTLWRQRAKIHASIKLLLHGKSVTETAADLNYSTTSAFSENFRRQMGLTPKQYVMKEKRLMKINEEDENLKGNSCHPKVTGKKKVKKICCPSHP